MSKVGVYNDPPLKSIKLTLTYYKGSKRRTDRANILSIHEKFLCDALVECGLISDDNDNIIKSTTYLSGNIDKENPRVECVIESI